MEDFWQGLEMNEIRAAACPIKYMYHSPVYYKSTESDHSASIAIL